MADKKSQTALSKGNHQKVMAPYEAPQVTTYTNKQILEKLGPARAGSPCGLNC